MTIIVKVNAADVSPLGECLVSARPYQGAEPQGGEPAFIWTCQTAGGKGLAMRGRVSEIIRHGGGFDLRIRVTDQQPHRPLTKEMLAPYRNGGDDPVKVGLSGKLYWHARTKVVELTEDEARFLDSFFADEAL